MNKVQIVMTAASLVLASEESSINLVREKEWSSSTVQQVTIETSVKEIPA